MGIDQFLKFISPSFTLYSVLITFGAISFKAFNLLWNFEKTLREENFSKVKDLLHSYQDRYIEPIIKERLTESVKIAYEKAFNPLIDSLYSARRIDDGQQVQELVSINEIIEIVERSALLERRDALQRSIEVDFGKYFSASSGDKLFNKLDEIYEQKSVFSKQYKKTFSSCRIASYSFIFLSILMFIGIIQILGNWPKWLIHFWCFLSVQTLIIGIISSICVEVCRRDLNRRWEALQFYDQV